MTDQTNVSYRIEHDTMGEVRVPSNRFWGAQTQRSLENFPIGIETMPREIIRAFGILKKAAALANLRLGTLDQDRATRIAAICASFAVSSISAKPTPVWSNSWLPIVVASYPIAPMVRNSAACAVYSVWIREPMEKSPPSRRTASGYSAFCSSMTVFSLA